MSTTIPINIRGSGGRLLRKTNSTWSAGASGPKLNNKQNKCRMLTSKWTVTFPLYIIGLTFRLVLYCHYCFSTRKLGQHLCKKRALKLLTTQLMEPSGMHQDSVLFQRPQYLQYQGYLGRGCIGRTWALTHDVRAYVWFCTNFQRFHAQWQCHNLR